MLLGKGWLLPATAHPVDADAILLALQTDLADALGLEPPVEQDERRLADQDTSRSGVGVRREQLLVVALEARRSVHSISHHHIFRAIRGAQRAGNHGAGKYANPHTRSWPALQPPAPVQLA